MSALTDYIIYLSVRFALFVLGLIPYRLQVIIISSLLKLATIIRPKYKKIALLNLRQAFPQKSEKEIQDIFRRSFDSLGRLVADSARLHSLDADWVRTHVEFPRHDEYCQLKEKYKGRGLLIATGHLGSFELLAHGAAVYGVPLSFVVRNFKAKKLDDWWRSVREANGNRVIARKGAYRRVVRSLKSGNDVGILFDQNVTRNLAVFVDLFGRPAATTRALALAALQCEPLVIVASIRYLGEDRYRIEWRERFSRIFTIMIACRVMKRFDCSRRK